MKEIKKISNNEIDILWELFKKYKRMIFIITFASFLISVLYVMVWYKPMYQSIALMQIGKLNGKLIEETKVLNLKLDTAYSGVSKTLPKIVNIKSYDKRAGLIRLDAKGHSKKALDKYLRKIVQNIVTEHTVIYNKYIDNTIQTFNHYTSLIENKKKDISHLKGEIQKDEKYLDTAKNDNQTLINMYTLKLLRDDTTLHHNENSLTKTNLSMISYRNRLLATKTYNTHLYREVELLPDLVNTRKSIILIVGFITGLLLSLLLSLFLSFITSRKN